MTAHKKNQALVDRQRDHFNAIADQYNNARSHKNHLLIKELIWHNALKNLSLFDCLKDQKTYNLLEPMCGFAEGGALVSHHMDIAINYSGFDYSDVVIEKLKKQNPDILVWQEDATQWHPEDNTYDIIILIGGLHHVPDHAAEVVKNLSHGLKKGGIFINFEPTYGNPITQWIRKKIYQKNALFDEKTERDFSVKELKNYFLAASLSPLRIRYPGVLSYILFYNPDAFPLLNRGGQGLVKTTFLMDRLLYKTKLGAFLSFATLSIWQKNDPK